MCIIGYRALRRAHVPPAGRLGLYGFGASAHLTAQIAVRQGVEVHVLTRDPPARRLALELGAASAGPAYGRPPVPLDAAIVFAPVGDLVPVALAAMLDLRTHVTEYAFDDVARALDDVASGALVGAAVQRGT